MAVIWKDKIVINKKLIEGNAYLSDKFVTEKMKKDAMKLDRFILEELLLIKKEAQRNGLLALKGKDGVVRLWYFVGEKIKEFINKHVLPEDIKYIWRAFWENIPEEIAPGDKESTLVGSNRDPIYYCFLLGQYEEKFVVNAGHWRAWREFLDRKHIRDDQRIIKWISTRAELNPPSNWLRIFNREISRKLKNIDSSVYEDLELFRLLDQIWQEIFCSKRSTETQ